jgi:hypothetical protein
MCLGPEAGSLDKLYSRTGKAQAGDLAAEILLNPIKTELSLKNKLPKHRIQD